VRLFSEVFLASSDICGIMLEAYPEIGPSAWVGFCLFLQIDCKNANYYAKCQQICQLLGNMPPNNAHFSKMPPNNAN
jgi:hypothetical protein